MPDIKIRGATKSDTAQILDLLYQLGRPKPQTKSAKSVFEKLILQYLKDEDKKILVAELDGVLVGMISIVFVKRLNQTNLELYVPELVVLESHRNIGIGKSLINHCIKIAKKKNCFRIRLESGHKRKKAHKFYDSLGFDQYAKTYKLDLG